MAKYNKELVDNDKVEFIHVSLDQSEDQAEKWAAKEQFPWLHVMHSKLKKSDLMKYKTSRGVPSYILVDASGKELAKGSHQVFAKAKELK